MDSGSSSRKYQIVSGYSDNIMVRVLLLPVGLKNIPLVDIAEVRKIEETLQCKIEYGSKKLKRSPITFMY